MAWTREQMAARAAQELKGGEYVNFGIGLPTMIPSYLPENARVTIHAENGILGLGPFPYEDEVDPDLIDAGKQTVTVQPSASVFGSDESFAMIRGGHIGVAVLGALQVAANGDIANWMAPGHMVKGIGGATDLVSGVPRLIALMEHVTRAGDHRLLEVCTLPLTGRGVVSRVITDLAVLEVVDGSFILVECAPGVTLEQVTAATSAPILERKAIA